MVGRVGMVFIVQIAFLIKEGEVRGIKGIGRGWKVKKRDLQRYIEEL